MVPLWISDFLFCHVLPDALEYLAGILRCTGSEAGGNSTAVSYTHLVKHLPDIKDMDMLLLWKFFPQLCSQEFS